MTQGGPSQDFGSEYKSIDATWRRYAQHQWNFITGQLDVV